MPPGALKATATKRGTLQVHNENPDTPPQSLIKEDPKVPSPREGTASLSGNSLVRPAEEAIGQDAEAAGAKRARVEATPPSSSA